MADGVTSPNNYYADVDIESVASSVASASKNKKKKSKRKRSSSSNDETNFKDIIKGQQLIIKNLQEEVSKLKQIIQKIEDQEEVMEEDDEYPPLPGDDNSQQLDANNPPMPGVDSRLNSTIKDGPKTPGTMKANDAAKQTSNNEISPATKVGARAAANKKPPPINVFNADPKVIINTIKNNIKGCYFNINIVNRNVLKITAQQSTEHLKIVNLLKSEGVKFFTFTPKENKSHTFIIRKLPLGYDVEDVQEAMCSLKINAKITKVFKTKYNWLVQVASDTDCQEILKIKYLLHCRVEVEFLKKKSLVQCKNCQRFNHSAVNCNMPYRCVKCAESHEPGKCLIPKKEDNVEVIVLTDEITGVQSNRIGLPVKCANCGKEGHTANAPVCEVKKMLLARKKGIKPVKYISTSVVHNPISKDVSYASLLKNNVTKARPLVQNSSFSAFDAINNDCHEIFGKDFLQCISKVGEFNKSYSLLKSKEDKTKALFSLFLTLKLDE